jgi:hypothetical protein
MKYATRFPEALVPVDISVRRVARLLRVGIVLLVQYSSIRLCPRSAVWLLYCFLDSIALDVRCIISMLKSIEVKI